MTKPSRTITLNEKDVKRKSNKETTIQVVPNFIGTSEGGLQTQDSNQTLPSNTFIGRRRQSPQPNIFGIRTKTPLKLLHYHKKKSSV